PGCFAKRKASARRLPCSPSRREVTSSPSRSDWSSRSIKLRTASSMSIRYHNRRTRRNKGRVGSTEGFFDFLQHFGVHPVPGTFEVLADNPLFIDEKSVRQARDPIRGQHGNRHINHPQIG